MASRSRRGTRRVYGERRVEDPAFVVAGDYVHGVEVFLLQHLHVIGVVPERAELPGELLRLFLIEVAGGNRVHGRPLERGIYAPPGVTSAADTSDVNLMLTLCPLNTRAC